MFWLFFLVFASTAVNQPDSAGQEGCVTIVAAGDILLDRGVRKTAWVKNDPAYPLEYLPQIFDGADIALANLEGPLTKESKPVGKMFAFRGDPEYAARLSEAGLTMLTLANNHIYDYGRRAILETISSLEQEGVSVVGAGKDLAHASRPVFRTIGDQTIAVLGFVTMPLEGIVWLPEKPCPASTVESVSARNIRQADQKADLVIVTVHWGTEYSLVPDPEQLQWSAFFRRHGADMVIGHHPHVIQPVERVGGKWVFYSLGNFVFDQTRRPRNLAIAARLKICRKAEPVIDLIPLEISDTRPTPAKPDARDEILKILRGNSEDLDFTPRGGKIRVSVKAGY